MLTEIALQLLVWALIIVSQLYGADIWAGSSVGSL